MQNLNNNTKEQLITLINKLTNKVTEFENFNRYYNLDEEADILFKDLFNINDIQQLQDEFSSATGVASIITDINGVPITNPSNFTNLCSKIIRNTKKGIANCYKSDSEIGKMCSGGPTIQTCLSGGLWDAGAGISVGGKHIANWLIGQVRDETQTDEQMLKYAKEIGANEDSLIKEFRNVPAMSQTKFAHISQVLYTLAMQLSSIAYQNIKQINVIKKLEKTEGKLRISETNLKYTFDISPALICVANSTTGFFTKANLAVTRILGWSVKEFTSKPFMDFVHPDDKQKTINEVSLQLKGNPVAYFKNRYICKNGSYCWLSWQATKALPDGKVYAIAIDITEQLKAEDLVKEYQENLEDLVKERTKELEEKNKKLDNAMKVFVGRELKIKELQNKLKALEDY